MILHLTHRLSARGGADWHLLGVLQAQRRRGIELHLAVSEVDGSVDAPCPMTRMEHPHALGALVQQLRPDLIHLHNVTDPHLLTLAAAGAAPTVITVQDHRCFCPGRGKWRASSPGLPRGSVCREPMARERCSACFTDAAYFEEILARTMARLEAVRRLTAVTVLSHYMKQELVQAGVEAGRIHVIPPFVHGLPPARRSESDRCVLFVGRMVPAKGPLEAVQAWRDSGLRQPLVFAGTGSARQQVERDAPDVRVLGWVPHDQLAALYRRASVLVMPCRWQEPFGIVGLEGVSLGLPVAAWDSGGVGEWHPGPLVPWGDVAALAHALRKHADASVAPRPGPVPVAGFEEEPLMDRLVELYRTLGGA